MDLRTFQHPPQWRLRWRLLVRQKSVLRDIWFLWRLELRTPSCLLVSQCLCLRPLANEKGNGWRRLTPHHSFRGCVCGWPSLIVCSELVCVVVGSPRSQREEKTPTSTCCCQVWWLLRLSILQLVFHLELMLTYGENPECNRLCLVD